MNQRFSRNTTVSQLFILSELLNKTENRRNIKWCCCSNHAWLFYFGYNFVCREVGSGCHQERFRGWKKLCQAFELEFDCAPMTTGQSIRAQKRLLIPPKELAHESKVQYLFPQTSDASALFVDLTLTRNPWSTSNFGHTTV